MCNKRNLFSTFGPSDVKTVKVANNSEMKVLGEGSVVIEVTGAWDKKIKVTLASC